jgi:hypothetical protein
MKPPCFICAGPAAIAVTAHASEVIALCLECASRMAVEEKLPALAAAVAHYKATALPPTPPGMFAVRIRPGVQRDDAGRWRPICHVTDPTGEVHEYHAEWCDGADAEQRAEARAREYAAAIRRELANRPGITTVE